MNVEIGAEAAQFPEKEYINGIAVAVAPEGICTTVGLNGILRICRKKFIFRTKSCDLKKTIVRKKRIKGHTFAYEVQNTS